jgi:predicted transcriptional regulator/transcriptional regulator with XRE-family HTH domain
MAENKIFAGPRIRRIRRSLDLTQSAMAADLGISPSYLNLIERNQRPLTVQLLLKLAATYKIDLDELRAEIGAGAAGLKEVFADPLLVNEVPGPQEILEVADAAPNVAAAVAKLYRAYREQQQRLSDLSALLAREGAAAVPAQARLPFEEVRDVFENRANHFAAIEADAEAFHDELAGGGNLPTALATWLKNEHGLTVRVLPVQAMPLWRRRLDRHSMRLMISERLSLQDQLREIAAEACQLRMHAIIAAEIEKLKPTSDEARRLARFEFGRYAAHALIMPYGSFHSAAQRARYDVDMLRTRFGVSFEQAANRLTTLVRPGQAGIPFFMLEIDQAGNRFRRAGAQGFPQARFGGECPKLAVHAAFTRPGQVLCEKAIMPSGAEFLLIARTLETPVAVFGERLRNTAILLGCDAGFADETVYGQALAKSGPPLEIGPACRVCERSGCLSRAEPAITRPLGLDDMVSGVNAFDHL